MRLSDVGKKLTMMIGVTALVFIFAGAVYYRSMDIFPFTIGVLLSAALNVLKVTMIERNLDKALDMEAQDARNFMRLQYFLRYLLTGGVLALAVFTPFISLWGVIAGIFTLQVAAFSMKFFFGK